MGFKNSYDLMKNKILQNDEFKGNVYTDWGIQFEPIATLIYEQRNKNRIIEFGLIEHPNKYFSSITRWNNSI